MEKQLKKAVNGDDACGKDGKSARHSSSSIGLLNGGRPDDRE